MSKHSKRCKQYVSKIAANATQKMNPDNCLFISNQFKNDLQNNVRLKIKGIEPAKLFFLSFHDLYIQSRYFWNRKKSSNLRYSLSSHIRIYTQSHNFV